MRPCPLVLLLPSLLVGVTASSAACRCHLYAYGPYLSGLVESWKPQIVANSIVTLTGTTQYARARLIVNQGASVYGYWAAGNGPLFLFDGSSKCTASLMAVCWTPKETFDRQEKLRRFREMSAWHESLSSSLIVGDGLMSEDFEVWMEV